MAVCLPWKPGPYQEAIPRWLSPGRPGGDEAQPAASRSIAGTSARRHTLQPRDAAVMIGESDAERLRLEHLDVGQRRFDHLGQELIHLFGRPADECLGPHGGDDLLSVEAEVAVAGNRFE